MALLTSIARARLLFILSEGPVAGFLESDGLYQTPASRIQLNGVPLESFDGSGANQEGFLSNLRIYFRNGAETQPIIPERSQNTVVHSVGQTVLNGKSAKRIITNPNAVWVQVTLKVPLLHYEQPPGNFADNALDYQIRLENVDGTLNYVEPHRVLGQARGAGYQRQHLFSLVGYAPPWYVSLEKTSPDQSGASRNDLEFDFYTVIEADVRSYAGFCVLGIDSDSTDPKAISRVDVDLTGQYVLIPHNYDGRSRTSQGSFNGTLIPGWTDNPVWCCLHALLGDKALSRIKVYEFYSAALYCDERLNGKPRFSFNHVYYGRRPGITAAEEIASSFNGKLTPSGTKIGIHVDRPAPVRTTFFADDMSSLPVYSRASSLEVPTICTVEYEDALLNYEPTSVVVRDEIGIARYGERHTTLKAIGCVERSQAQRTAMWALATPRLNGLVVNFQRPLTGYTIARGDVFRLIDGRRELGSASGRLLDFFDNPDGSQTAILDKAYPFDYTINLDNYRILFVGTNGNYWAFGINALASKDRTILIPAQSALSQTERPKAGDNYRINRSDLESGYLFRCSEIVPVNGKANHFDIEGILYDSSKFDYIESLGATSGKRYSARRQLPTIFKRYFAETNDINFTEKETRAVDETGRWAIATKLAWNWTGQDDVTFIVQAKPPGGAETTWAHEAIAIADLLIIGRAPGSHEYRIVGIDRFKNEQIWLNPTRLPSDYPLEAISSFDDVFSEEARNRELLYYSADLSSPFLNDSVYLVGQGSTQSLLIDDRTIARNEGLYTLSDRIDPPLEPEQLYVDAKFTYTLSDRDGNLLEPRIFSRSGQLRYANGDTPSETEAGVTVSIQNLVAGPTYPTGLTWDDGNTVMSVPNQITTDVGPRMIIRLFREDADTVVRVNEFKRLMLGRKISTESINIVPVVITPDVEADPTLIVATFSDRTANITQDAQTGTLTAVHEDVGYRERFAGAYALCDYKIDENDDGYFSWKPNGEKNLLVGFNYEAEKIDFPSLEAYGYTGGGTGNIKAGVRNSTDILDTDIIPSGDELLRIKREKDLMTLEYLQDGETDWQVMHTFGRYSGELFIVVNMASVRCPEPRIFGGTPIVTQAPLTEKIATFIERTRNISQNLQTGTLTASHESTGDRLRITSSYALCDYKLNQANQGYIAWTPAGEINLYVGVRVNARNTHYDSMPAYGYTNGQSTIKAGVNSDRDVFDSGIIPGASDRLRINRAGNTLTLDYQKGGSGAWQVLYTFSSITFDEFVDDLFIVANIGGNRCVEPRIYGGERR